MTDKAEFERLLDVYGFRCERFGQDLSTHARAQVVSAFAALASAPVAEPYDSEKRCRAYYDSDLRPFAADGLTYNVWQAVWHAAQFDRAMTPDSSKPRQHSAPVAGEQIIAWDVQDTGLGRRYTTYNPKIAEDLMNLGENVRPLVYASALPPANAAPQASAEDVRELPDAEMRTLIGNYFADDWAKEAAAGLLHDYARALKQPQADKDGGQQRAGDVVRDALWTLTEHNALHFGEQHSTVIQGRAALSAPQAEQGERDE